MSASIREATPSTPDSQSQFVYLSDAVGAEIKGLLEVPHDVPVGSNAEVIRSELRIHAAEDIASITFTIEPIDEEWIAATETWPGPDVRTPSVVQGFSDVEQGDELSINVTSMVAESVSSEDATGARWLGVRLSADALFSIYGSGAGTLRPRLVSEASTPPLAPFDIKPDGLRAVSEVRPEIIGQFRDLDAGDTITRIHLQVTDDDTFATLLYDSGEVDHTLPRFDMAAPPTGSAVVTDLPLVTDLFGHMKFRDARGLWSEWSEIFSFRIEAKGVLTLTSGAVTGPTPTTTATFTGTTLKAWEVIWERLVGDQWVTHHRRAMSVHAGPISYTLPDEDRLQEGETYRETVNAQDTVEREDMPGDVATYTDSREVTLPALVVA